MAPSPGVPIAQAASCVGGLWLGAHSYLLPLDLSGTESVLYLLFPALSTQAWVPGKWWMTEWSNRCMNTKPHDQYSPGWCLCPGMTSDDRGCSLPIKDPSKGGRAGHPCRPVCPQEGRSLLTAFHPQNEMVTMVILMFPEIALPGPQLSSFILLLLPTALWGPTAGHFLPPPLLKSGCAGSLPLLDSHLRGHSSIFEEWKF